MRADFDLSELLIITPLLFLFGFSLIPIALKVFQNNKERNSFATVIYALMGLVGATAAILSLGNKGLIGQRFIFDKALVFDSTGIFVAFLVIFVTSICLIFSRENLATRTNQFSEYVFLLMNAAVGMIIVAWANDLIVTFIGIEIMSLCLYVLIALSAEGRVSKEAAFKYFVLGSFASAIFLYGVAFIYGTTGTTYIDQIRATMATGNFESNGLFIMGAVLTVLGFCFKVSIAPFHAWTPDVYEGAPTPITAFMATGVKLVSFVAFLRFVTSGAAELTVGLVDVMQWLAAATMLVGNIAAIMQSNLKRMLAYSSVAHSGYIMMALIAASFGGFGNAGASGVLFYSATYVIMTLGAFGMISLFEKDEDTQLHIDDLKGLASRRPAIALLLTIFLLSLAGIPPTIGFFGKFYVFAAALKQGLLWLTVWGVLSSVIAVYYYLRPIVTMYMSDEGETDIAFDKETSIAAILITAAMVIGGALFVSPVYTYIEASVAQLF